MSSPHPIARSACTRRGFTLVEVLVVVVIVGISLGLVVVNLAPDRASILDGEARRLALMLQFARDDAVVRGAALAWTADAEGYRFSRRERGRGWVTLGTARAEGLEARAWAPQVTALLRVSGQPVPAGQPLVFSPSGFNPQYELTLASGPWRAVLAANIAGKVRLERARREDAPRP